MNIPNYTRRDFLKGLGSAMALCSLPNLLRANESSAEKWNIVFIVADDLGWTDLSCYGSDLHETPNIDKLATQGMSFSDAYAAAPVCTPTRASIMTGKYPARLHMTTWRENSKDPTRKRQLIPPITESDLSLDQVTIAKVLKEAGYFTAHVGKWHLGDASHYPDAHGFDINVGGTHWGAPETYFYPYRGRHGKDLRYVPDLESGNENENAYLTDRLTDEALKIIEAVRNIPFFLHLSYHTVHTPIEGKPELVEHFRKKVKPDMLHQHYEYAAMAYSLDENVGRVLTKIDKLGLADRTIVIFYSDNGGRIGRYGKWKTVANNTPLRSGKGSLYEGGIRVPLIIRWPGVTKPGSKCHQPVTSYDFYPTILEILGLTGDAKHNANMDGISFLPLLKEPSGKLKRSTLYWHYPHYYRTTSPVSALRQDEWKLLEYFEDNHVELYNLAKDLGESDNLANKIPEKAEELRQKLASWREQVNAQMPNSNPDFDPNQANTRSW